MSKYVLVTQKSYGFGHFLWDLFMTFLTCGLWFVWILYRHLRKS